MIWARIKSLFQKLLSNPIYILVIVILSAVVLRFLYYYFTRSDPYMQFRVGDEDYYHSWALQISSGHFARGASFFTTPLYAYFLALVYFLGSTDIDLIRLLNLLFGLGSILLVWLAAREFFNQRVATVAAILFGFCSAPIYYEWFPEKTALVLFLTAAAFYLVSRALNGHRLILWLAAGIGVGIASLAHMLLFVMVPAVVAHVVMNRPAEKSALLKTLIVFFAGFLLGVMPATIHNYLQDGDFVLVSSSGGATFYIGNFSGNTTGEYTSPPFSSANSVNEDLDFKHEAERLTQRTMNPSEVSKFWLKQGLTEMKEHPRLSLMRIARRVQWTLSASEPTDTRTYEFYQPRYQVLRAPFWGFGLVSCLGILGFLLACGTRSRVVLTSFILLFIAEISLFLVYGRYRLPLLVPMALLGAFALCRLYEFVEKRRFSAFTLSVLTACAAGWFVYVIAVPDVQISFFPDFYNQGNKYVKLGKYDLAAEEYEKALTVRPGDHPAAQRLYVALANEYIISGQTQRATQLLLRGVKQFPANQTLRAKLEDLLKSGSTQDAMHDMNKVKSH